ncbi:RNA helicase, partial [Oxalobacteraceae bacterium OM1]
REPLEERARSDHRHVSREGMDRPGRRDFGNRSFERTDRPERGDATERSAFPRKERVERAPEAGMQSFRIEVGYVHGVKPGNIVGAIANEAGLNAKHIGRIEIYDDYSTLDLPASLPDDLLSHLKTVWVAGRQLHISREGEPAAARDVTSRPSRTPGSENSGTRTDAVSRKRPSERHEQAERPAAHKGEHHVSRNTPAMQTYRIEVGHVHGVKPANIVGAIANEAGLEAKYIGRIDIHDDYSTLDLPEGMPKEVFKQLQTVAVSGQPLRISRAAGPAQGESTFTDRKPLKPKPGSGKQVAEGTRTKPKPHRKGTKPA